MSPVVRIKCSKNLVDILKTKTMSTIEKELCDEVYTLEFALVSSTSVKINIYDIYDQLVCCFGEKTRFGLEMLFEIQTENSNLINKEIFLMAMNELGI